MKAERQRCLGVMARRPPAIDDPDDIAVMLLAWRRLPHWLTVLRRYYRIEWQLADGEIRSGLIGYFDWVVLPPAVRRVGFKKFAPGIGPRHRVTVDDIRPGDRVFVLPGVLLRRPRITRFGRLR